MKEDMPIAMRKQVTRRAFLEQVGVAGVLLGATSLLSRIAALDEARPSVRESRGEVVWFHMDRLHLDTTGGAEPYRPPPGARSAAPIEHLTEEEFRSRHVYV